MTWHDSKRLCRWLIAGQTQPWTTTLNRFAPMMCPPKCVASITTVPLGELVPQAKAWLYNDAADSPNANPLPWILIWSIQPNEVPMVIDQAIELNARPSSVMSRLVMPIVACDRLDSTGRLALGESGVSLFLRHPEDLARFAAVIGAHFQAAHFRTPLSNPGRGLKVGLASG